MAKTDYRITTFSLDQFKELLTHEYLDKGAHVWYSEGAQSQKTLAVGSHTPIAIFRIRIRHRNRIVYDTACTNTFNAAHILNNLEALASYERFVDVDVLIEKRV